MTPVTIGRHRAARVDDSLRVAFVGPMIRADIEAVRRIVGEILADHGRCFLIGDMRECTGIAPETRHYVAEWSRHPDEEPTRVLVYGLSFAMRTVVSLTRSAIKLFGGKPDKVVIVADEAEALQRAAALRAASVSRAS
jgi:hypothetical protein